MLDWPRPDGPCGEPWQQIGNPVLVDLREVLDVIDRYASAWRRDAAVELAGGSDRADSCIAKAVALEAVKLALVEQLGPMSQQSIFLRDQIIRAMRVKESVAAKDFTPDTDS